MDPRPVSALEWPFTLPSAAGVWRAYLGRTDSAPAAPRHLSIVRDVHCYPIGDGSNVVVVHDHSFGPDKMSC